MRLLLALAALGVAFAAPAADLVTNLPGLNDPVNFQTYSGYLSVGTSKHFHYWFVTSQGNPSVDPLVLWLNGGPGCSSLDGLLQENGPYFAKDDGSGLYLNPYSWNLYANVLYLESPAGVGFSYSDKPSDYNTGDEQTSQDNWEAIQAFLTAFPEYQGREFFITGESYAGVYIPTLVQRIQTYNAASTGLNVNLKAFGIGNGLVSDRLNDNSLLFFANYHGLFGQDLWQKLRSECCSNPGDDHTCNFHNPKPASPCFLHTIQAQYIIYYSGLNFYDLYADCASNALLDAKYRRTLNGLFKNYNWNLGDKLASLEKQRAESRVGQQVPCIYSVGMENYLNRVDVQTALHVKLGIDWEICSDVLHYNRTDTDVEPLYAGLLTSYRALIYAGDTDLAVNYLGNEWGVDDLNRTSVDPRRTWIDVNGQVAGFVHKYDKITFLTIKGAGHMVPQFRPVQALQMFKNFLQDTPY